MPHRTWSAALAALCLLLALAADAPQQQTTLRYKFKKGDRLFYAVEQKAAMKFDLGGKLNPGGAGQDFGALYTFRLEWTITVLDVDAAGKARIECKLDRLRLEMTGLGKDKMTVDSDDLKAIPQEGQRQTIKALKEQGVSLTIDPTGEASDVKMPEEIKEAGPGQGDVFIVHRQMVEQLYHPMGLVFPKESRHGVKGGSSCASRS